jgi:hypothetical protein
VALTNKLRAFLHPKAVEFRTPSQSVNTTGAVVVAADMGTGLNRMFEIISATSMWVYLGIEDAWLQLPSSGLGGTPGAGNCGEFHPDGPSGTATGGTTTTLVTNLTIVRDLRGNKIRVLSGPNAGLDFVIKSNTIGANSVITITTTAPVAFTAVSAFVLKTGRLWVFFPSTTVAGFGYYDWALHTWTARAITGLPASFLNEGQLVGADSLRSGELLTGTASAGAATTITIAGAPVTNALANLQIRIKSGTGAGQIRVITSNAGNVLTVPAWTTNPDATSVYAIEGDDNAMYLLGNSAVTMYKYSISANTWATIAPAVARAAAPGAGMTADLITGVRASEDASGVWNDVTQPLNGRYIYCFRAGGSTVLDRYDIALNSWAVVSYGDQAEQFATGTSAVASRERIYINVSSGNRIHYFDVVLNTLRPFAAIGYGAGAATVGDKLAVLRYTDGAEFNFVYWRRPSGVELMRIGEIR